MLQGTQQPLAAANMQVIFNYTLQDVGAGFEA